MRWVIGESGSNCLTKCERNVISKWYGEERESLKAWLYIFEYVYKSRDLHDFKNGSKITYKIKWMLFINTGNTINKLVI